MTSLVKHTEPTPCCAAAAEETPAVAQCCAKISRMVAGCHD